jgi:hypothetical protein
MPYLSQIEPQRWCLGPRDDQEDSREGGIYIRSCSIWKARLQCSLPVELLSGSYLNRHLLLFCSSSVLVWLQGMLLCGFFFLDYT